MSGMEVKNNTQIGSQLQYAVCMCLPEAKLKS